MTERDEIARINSQIGTLERAHERHGGEGLAHLLETKRARLAELSGE